MKNNVYKIQELTILHYLIIVNFQNVIYSCEFEYFIDEQI